MVGSGQVGIEQQKKIEDLIEEGAEPNGFPSSTVTLFLLVE